MSLNIQQLKVVSNGNYMGVKKICTLCTMDKIKLDKYNDQYILKRQSIIQKFDILTSFIFVFEFENQNVPFPSKCIESIHLKCYCNWFDLDCSDTYNIDGSKLINFGCVHNKLFVTIEAHIGGKNYKCIECNIKMKPTINDTTLPPLPLLDVYIWNQIIKYLDKQTILALQRTCKYFRQEIFSNTYNSFNEYNLFKQGAPILQCTYNENPHVDCSLHINGILTDNVS